MSKDHYTIGFSFAFGHGTSGVVLKNGHVVAAANLERILGVKYAWLCNVDLADDVFRDIASKTPQREPWPIQMYFQRLVDYLLETAGIAWSDVDLVAYDLYSCATTPYRKEDPGKNDYLDDFFRGKTVIRVDHHTGHQAQAFYPSPFDEAAVLTIDGASYANHARLGGRPLSSTIGFGKDEKIEVLMENVGAGISGKEYMRTTAHIGFGLNEDGKTMGLAPYGGPSVYDRVRTSWKWRLNPFYRRQHTIRPEHDFPRDNFNRLSKEIRDSHGGQYMSRPCQDLAWAVQQRCEERVLRAARIAWDLTKCKNLVYAGGVALNSVANRKILKETPFENIFVYPNAGDCGLATGYALWAYHQATDGANEYVCRHDYLGKIYPDADVEAALAKVSDKVSVTRMPRKGEPGAGPGHTLEEEIAQRMIDGSIVGWYQGGAEFGPRALGHRSILCDCRRHEHKDILNARVKHREPYRPFAPVVKRTHLAEYFDLDCDAPFMLLVPDVLPDKREVIPSVTHVDGTGRVQTVTEEDNGAYYHLIDAFHRKTGVPVILNTSFNIAGKPIVETPDDAVECFLWTDIDMLVLEDRIVEKKK